MSAERKRIGTETFLFLLPLLSALLASLLPALLLLLTERAKLLADHHGSPPRLCLYHGL